MTENDSAYAYLQSTALGATPVGQVVALYDTILRDLRRALAAIEAGKIEKRVDAVNHALTVVGELQGVLDFERGGVAARNLDDFYKVARALMLQASMGNSREQCQEVAAMFTRVRAAWAKIENTIPPSEPSERPRISSTSRPAQANRDPVPADNAGNAGGGNWIV